MAKRARLFGSNVSPTRQCLLQNMSEGNPSPEPSKKLKGFTKQNILDVLDKVGFSTAKWRELGLRLKPELDFDGIDHNYKTGERCLEEVIERWKQDGDNPSWETLAEAVFKCKKGGGKNMATKIKQEVGLEVLVEQNQTETRTKTTGNSGSRRTKWKCWQRLTCAGLVCGIILFFIILVPTFSLWKITSSSRHTQVFAGDVVLVLSIQRFWYNQAKIRQQSPDGAQETEATIYIETCASKERINETKFSSRPLLYTCPQGLQSLQSQYLLDGSVLAITLTTHATPESDASAKVCQYLNADDFDQLIHASTKASVDEAEKNGLCLPIEPHSSSYPHTTVIQFNVHSHGYYWYALAVVPGEQINISYTYTLIKHYYDKDELTPYDCSVLEECVIDDLINKKAADCVLAYIPTPAGEDLSLPYTFVSKQTQAWGISIVFFSVAFCIALCISIFIFCLCCIFYKKCPLW